MSSYEENYLYPSQAQYSGVSPL